MMNNSIESNGPRSPQRNGRWMRWLPRLLVMIVILYPPFELFIWTPAAMKVYCPKRDSSTRSLDSMRSPFGAATSVFIVDDSERSPSDLPSILIALREPVNRVAVPTARISPPELRELLRTLSGGQRFVEFSDLASPNGECEAFASAIGDMLSVLPGAERTLVEQSLSFLEREGRCVAMTLADTVSVDYLEVTSDSTIETSVGKFTLFALIGVPLDPKQGALTVVHGGSLDPSLPVTRFVSRTIANGYVDCDE